jgi:flagellar basal-body rod modification protein FlgD
MDAALAVSTANSAVKPAGSGGIAGISGEDFMKILVKQLQMQDPLQPMDNQQMVAQIATIRQLEMNTQLSDKLGQLTDQQRFGSAASLIGKHVKGTVSDDDGNEFEKEGLVVSVHFTSKGDAMLELNSGEMLPLSSLDEVKNADGSEVTPPTPELSPAPTNASKLINLKNLI